MPLPAAPPMVIARGPDPARNEFDMVYDSARGVTVLFGGVIANAAGSHFGETWTYDGNRWKLARSVGPERRAAPQMAYDERRRTVILQTTSLGSA